MKILKRILLGLLILVLLLVVVVRLTVHESRPEIKEGANADAVAQKILSAVDKPAWDTLNYVQWTFPRGHSYIWDRPNNNAVVKWDDYEVHLNMDEVDGRAWQNGEELSEGAKSKAIQKAWSFWCNDSFWFSAPFKLFDPGTERNIAVDKDGKEGLLISYASGGVTPGDQYLWYYDDQGMPTGYKMWVKIIPIGGVYASWTDWTTLAGYAKVATKHMLDLVNMEIEMTNIKSGQRWSDLGYDQNPIKL